jgi:hypothetical protein
MKVLREMFILARIFQERYHRNFEKLLIIDWKTGIPSEESFV